MAGLALCAISILGVGSGFGQTANENSAPSQPRAKAEARQPDANRKSTASGQAVALTLRIAGLGAEGCDIEIKPANPTCKFQPIKKHLDSSGYVENLMIKNVEVLGADRNCSFAITVSERGQKPRTVVRGFRMAKSATDTGQVQAFACAVSAPSKLARLEETGTTRRK